MVRGRLNRVDLAATSAAPYKRTDYAHDANGNRTAVERRTNVADTNAAQSDSYAKAAGTNRLASITTASGIRSITPDARGNTASESRPGGITVSTGYDGHGRLVSYSQSGTISLAHSYNGLGDRTATTATPPGGAADTRRFVTAPDGRIVGEYGSSATDVKAEFIWLSPQVGDTGPFGGDDGLGGYAPIALATAASGGGTILSWVHGDHLGTPIVMTDASGTAIAQPTGYTATAFPGQSKTLADLYYNRYRDYDPTTGRYIQADPIGLAGGPNPYSYAMGNPLRYVDPMGLECLNLFPYDEGNYRAAAAKHCRDFDRPGDLHIMSHGTPNKICPFSRTECMPPEKFVDVYGPQLAGAKSIFLKSCYGGRRMSRSPAQFLSNATGVPVTAYPDLTWWRPNDGFTCSGPRERTLKEWFQDWGGLREAHPYKYQGVPKHNGPRDTSQPREPITFQPGH